MCKYPTESLYELMFNKTLVFMLSTHQATTYCSMELVRMFRGLFCGDALAPFCQQLDHRHGHGVRPQVPG